MANIGSRQEKGASAEERDEKASERRTEVAGEELQNREYEDRQKGLRQEPEDKRATARQTTPAGKGRSQ